MSKPLVLFIQNDLTDPPHLVGDWLAELGCEIKVLRADLGEAVPRIVPEDVTALIPLGGHMGAMDDHIAPWLADERALLADAISKGTPILGICLGSQLLGIAAGGTVTRAAHGEIGIYEIDPTIEAASDPVFDIPAGTSTTQWHEDEVTALPASVVTLASSERCANQIYRVAPGIYGVQFHPEADLSIVSQWQSEPDNAFLTLGKRDVLPEVAAATAQIAAFWRPVVERWARLFL